MKNYKAGFLIVTIVLSGWCSLAQTRQKRICWVKNRFRPVLIMAFKLQGTGKFPGQRRENQFLSGLCTGLCNGKTGGCPGQY